MYRSKTGNILLLVVLATLFSLVLCPEVANTIAFSPSIPRDGAPTTPSSITKSAVVSVQISSNFQNGLQGWAAGFAGYRLDSYDIAELRTLPPETARAGTGFYVQGIGDPGLFIFLKRKLSQADGIVRGQAYQLNYRIVLASRIANDCAGIGGTPSEDIHLKAGGSSIEPKPDEDSDLLPPINVDVGQPYPGGQAASWVDNLPNGFPCHGNPGYVSLTKVHKHRTVVTAPSDGELWLLVGTQSQLELTTMSFYYQQIDVELKPVNNLIQFGQSSYSANEADGNAQISITRTGDTTDSATVSYMWDHRVSGTPRRDFTQFFGSVTFGPGEITKSFPVLITDNRYKQDPRLIEFFLYDPEGGGGGIPNLATLRIDDNDSSNGSTPIDEPQFFVRQHYSDFLSRSPDPAGLQFWINNITSCGSNPVCVEQAEINVSAAFFLSIEFQRTGYLVYRFYNASLSRSNGLPDLEEFLRDTQTIAQGVVVGSSGWEQLLEQNTQSFTDKFVRRQEFTSLYPETLSAAQFVDTLFLHAAISPTPVERQAALDEFNNPAGARGRALRRVAENQTLVTREFNRAFVLMQYFGYLRRNPDDTPDGNMNGYNFWLTKLNDFNGNYIDAEMVKAFIASTEYRERFGL